MLSFAGSAQRRAEGKFPSLSINRNGTIVEAHQPSAISTKMYYQVGTLNRNDVNFVEEREIVGSGKYPKVAITDTDRVIEVHEGTYSRRVYYNVGPLNHQRVQWQHRPTCLSPGRFPAVAVHGNRVVVTHDKAHFQYSTFYHVGIINEGGTAIDWGEKLQLFEVSRITKTTVAINEEFAVAAGRGWSTSHIVCRLGRFPNGDARYIDWLNEISLDHIGIYPKICLDDGGCAILVWQSSFFRHLIEGQIKQNGEQWMMEWQERRNYDYGNHPAIAITPINGQVVEEHETNLGSTLHIHVGRYADQRQEPQAERQQQQEQPARPGDEGQPGGEMEHAA